MTFDRIVPTLRMFSVEKAKAFYLDFLGCRIDWEHRFNPEAPLLMRVSRDSLVLHLSEHHGDGSPGVHIMVEMTGLDAFHAEIAARPYPYFNPAIADTPWGFREMAVIDPVGNRIRFVERKG